MKCKLFMTLMATLLPLSLCQELIGVPSQIGLYGNQISSSSSQAQAQAQASSSSDNAFFENIPLQNYINAVQGSPIAAVPSVNVPAVNVLAGAGLPCAGSPVPAFNPYAAQDAISESIAETNLANRIRQGNVEVVPPNLSTQAVLQSVQVPVQGKYSNRVYASQPLPPVVVTQPGSPIIQVSSGPAAVVRAAPVIYKQPPSIIYQNEVINRHPAPLSLNPVYVKVYKPGKKVLAKPC